ncbi:MAG: 1,4-dihydroxy-2-naphthoate octaprenyltransferase [Candidatus Dormibacteria bacterium]
MTDLAAAGRRGPGAAARLWLMGARPRTLGVGAVPVLLGAAASGHPKALPTLAALVVAVGLQVGANLANDYFDGRRGVDTAARVGPRRLTASGLVRPGAVLAAALACLAVAAAIGLWLALASGLGWLVLAGAIALAATLLYTGGPRPYAATGVVADLAVFAFFGLMATVATAAVQGSGLAARVWWAAVAIGLLAVAVLVANNLRDLATDRDAGRHTLVVRLGDGPARLFYSALIMGGVLVPTLGVLLGQLPLLALVSLLAVPALVSPLRVAGSRALQGRGLVPLLPLTTRLHLALGALLAAALLAAALLPHPVGMAHLW